jgi:hypothetical protein
MAFSLYRPAAVVEERGESHFIAPHPTPLREQPGVLDSILGSRYSLIGTWTDDCYESCLGSFKLLTREVILVNTPEHIK